MQPTTMQSPVPDQYEDMVSSADAVMDELFGAVEQSLHIQKVPVPPHSQTANLGDSNLDNLGLDDLGLDKSGLDDLDIMWLSPYSPPPSTNPEDPARPDQDPDRVPHQAGDQNWLTPVLIMCACGSAMLATVLWSIHLSQKLHQITAANSQPPLAPVITESENVSTFSKEVQELLATAPNLPPANPVTPVSPVPDSSVTTTLPSAPLTNAPLAAPQTVYVPVYQSPNTPLNTPLNTPVTALPPTSGEAPSANPVTPAYTLVGVLSLGDRSSAMFELEGSVQTITPGKLVGNTGWTLEKVQQRDVVLRRAQETKTVVVGQKF